MCVAPWRTFGGLANMSGRVVTVRTFEDAGHIRQKLASDGSGCVLVVDGGGSLERAILGDRLAELGVRNGWIGVLAFGAVRDVDALSSMNFGVFALGSVPSRGRLEGRGECDQPVTINGVCISPGEHIVIDRDGVVVVPHPL